jgi:hypothetical protein
MIIAPKFMKWWSRVNGFKVIGLTFFCWIIMDEKPEDFKSRWQWEKILNHERIHIEQQKDLFWIWFYPIYILEYLWYRISGKSHVEAYKSISFEREAYDNDQNPDYLKTRKRFAWIR